MNLTAAILAGGLGTRLRPVVADRPKVLAPVDGRPYLAYLLNQLAAAAVRDVVLLTGHGADQVRDAFDETYGPLRLIPAPLAGTLGTAGALRLALPHLGSPAVLLLNGDSYCDVDLDAFQRFHQGGASLVLARVPDRSRFGQVRVARDGRIVRFEEKGTGCGPARINAGIYLLDRSLIDEIPPGRPVSLERDMLPAWVAGRHVRGFLGGGRFLDVGTPESYAAAANFFRPTGSHTAAFVDVLTGAP